MDDTKPIELMVDDGVRLRQYALEDAPAAFALIDRNRQHLSQYEEPTAAKYPTLETFMKSITEPSNPLRLRFGIWANDTLVGSINITPDSETSQRAETGYYLGEKFSGKGYATRSLKRIVEYAFNEMNLTEVYARIKRDNEKSIKVVEKAGFKQIDTELYTIIKA